MYINEVTNNDRRAHHKPRNVRFKLNKQNEYYIYYYYNITNYKLKYKSTYTSKIHSLQK